MKCPLETDVENEYFSRPRFPGRYEVEIVDGKYTGALINHSLTLHNGAAHWSIELPDSVSVGDTLTLQCHVVDDAIGEGFVNVARITVIQRQEHPSGDSKPRETKGAGSKGGSDNSPSGIELPEVIEVHQEQWSDHEFDRHSACKIIQDEQDSQVVYTFYVNVDNVHLKTEMKDTKDDPKLLKAKYKYGNVLLGLALIQDESAKGNAESTQNDTAITIEDLVQRTSRAISPFLIPMINYLGALSAEDLESLGEIGDDS